MSDSAVAPKQEDSVEKNQLPGSSKRRKAGVEDLDNPEDWKPAVNDHYDPSLLAKEGPVKSGRIALPREEANYLKAFENANVEVQYTLKSNYDNEDPYKDLILRMKKLIVSLGFKVLCNFYGLKFDNRYSSIEKAFVATGDPDLKITMEFVKSVPPEKLRHLQTNKKTFFEDETYYAAGTSEEAKAKMISQGKLIAEWNELIKHSPSWKIASKRHRSTILNNSEFIEFLKEHMAYDEEGVDPQSSDSDFVPSESDEDASEDMDIDESNEEMEDESESSGSE